MYAIVTKMNSDGSFDEVGMNNRLPVSGLKTEKGILNRARSFARGKTFRVDFYATRHSEKSFKTLTETTIQPPAKPAAPLIRFEAHYSYDGGKERFLSIFTGRTPTDALVKAAQFAELHSFLVDHMRVTPEVE